MPFLPCLLCGNKLEKRTDKNGKPYFVCDPCGIQVFVRRKQGIGLLEEVFRNIRRAAIPFRVHAKNLHEIRALIKEIGEVKTEISKIGFFFLSDEETRAPPSSAPSTSSGSSPAPLRQPHPCSGSADGCSPGPAARTPGSLPSVRDKPDRPTPAFLRRAIDRAAPPNRLRWPPSPPPCG